MKLNIRQYVPHILLAIYCIVFIWGAINPFDRAVWWAENIPIFAIVSFLVFLYYRGVRFSNTAYIFMAFLPIIHTIGGHYTFERVPFDFVNNIFGFQRNMYDRFGHFSVGFFAYGIAEYMWKTKKVSSLGLGLLLGFTIIGTVAGIYEIIEWIYAVKEGGSAGIAFLGSQGDIWDAQKDMALDMLGAVFVLAILFVRHMYNKLNHFAQEER